MSNEYGYAELIAELEKEARVRKDGWETAVWHQAAYCKGALDSFVKKLSDLNRFPAVESWTSRQFFGSASHFGLIDIYPERKLKHTLCLNKNGKIWTYRCFQIEEDRSILIPGGKEIADLEYMKHTSPALERMAQILKAHPLN